MMSLVTVGQKTESDLQEAARASRGLAHRWSFGVSASAMVEWQVGVGRPTKRVELRSIPLQGCAREVTCSWLQRPSPTQACQRTWLHQFYVTLAGEPIFDGFALLS
jgi:hypothetical protein